MGGHDPYSASKGCAELVVASYRASFFPAERLRDHGVKLASARAGNVIGGGDWALDRLGVDLVEGFAKSSPVIIRNPDSIRPWQHVLEPLSGYLCLAAKMLGSDDPKFSDGWNFGPGVTGEISVSKLADLYKEAWGEGASWQAPDLGAQPHEAGTLRLAIDKARSMLGWQPVWSLGETVTKTVDWYRSYYEDKSLARELCARDLEAYSKACAR